MAGFGGCRDGPDGIGAETEHLGSLFDAIAGIGAGEEDEGVRGGVDAGGFGGGVEGVAGDYYGGCIGCRATWDGNAAGVRACETKEGGEGFGGSFFDDGKGGGGVVDVEVGVEDGEDEFRGYARSVGGSVEFLHETLIPGIDGVLEDFFDESEESIFADAGVGKLGIKQLSKFLRFVIFDQRCSRTSS